MIRAWFALLRTADWANTKAIKAKDLRGREFVSLRIERGKSDQWGHGFVTEMECCCAIASTSRAGGFEICPVHCCRSEEDWIHIAKLPQEVRTALFREVVIRALGKVGRELIRQSHQLYLLRIGGAMSMCDAGSSIVDIQTAGRWAGSEVATLYCKDAASCPALVAFPRWPTRSPAYLGKDLSLTQIKMSILSDKTVLSRERRRCNVTEAEVSPD
jgi:hypothetical protein